MEYPGDYGLSKDSEIRGLQKTLKEEREDYTKLNLQKDKALLEIERFKEQQTYFEKKLSDKEDELTDSKTKFELRGKKIVELEEEIEKQIKFKEHYKKGYDWSIQFQKKQLFKKLEDAGIHLKEEKKKELLKKTREEVKKYVEDFNLESLEEKKTESPREQESSIKKLQMVNIKDYMRGEDCFCGKKKRFGSKGCPICKLGKERIRKREGISGVDAWVKLWMNKGISIGISDN